MFCYNHVMEERITTAGIALRNGKVLITHRVEGGALSGKWEFPGGKQEPGETMPECLRREIAEELHLDIEVGRFFMQSTYEYAQGAVCLHAYYAYCKSEDISFHSDHDRLAWVTPNELGQYEFSPADIPIRDALQNLPLPVKDN